ncbi:MAG: hypothetical protein WCI73_15205, partial [Phycisphaerae bacterium]
GRPGRWAQEPDQALKNTEIAAGSQQAGRSYPIKMRTWVSWHVMRRHVTRASRPPPAAQLG